MAWKWIIIRLVINQIASLEEIENHWSLDDVYDYNEAFDITKEADWRAAERARNKAGKK